MTKSSKPRIPKEAFKLPSRRTESAVKEKKGGILAALRRSPLVGIDLKIVHPNLDRQIDL